MPHKSSHNQRGRMKLIDKVRENAEMTIRDLGRLSSDLGDNFGYNRESVEYVEGYIERTRARGATAEVIEGLVQVLGSFLGECIRHVYGGEWREFEGIPGIFFENGSGAFPFNKVGMQFKSGLKDSILAFFDTIPQLKAGEMAFDDDGDEIKVYEVDEPRRTSPTGHRLK